MAKKDQIFGMNEKGRLVPIHELAVTDTPAPKKPRSKNKEHNQYLQRQAEKVQLAADIIAERAQLAAGIIVEKTTLPPISNGVKEVLTSNNATAIDYLLAETATNPKRMGKIANGTQTPGTKKVTKFKEALAQISTDHGINTGFTFRADGKAIHSTEQAAPKIEEPAFA